MKQKQNRSVQLKGHRLRKCRDGNYFKEIIINRSRTNFCSIVERYFDDVGTSYVRVSAKKCGIGMYWLNLLGQRKRASVWCMTQKAIVTDCSHLLELRLANPLILSSIFLLSPLLLPPTTLPSSDRDLRPTLFAQPFPP